MFRRAIVRLTATYLSIIMVISIFFSVNIYALATHELDRGYGRRSELIINAPPDLPNYFKRQLLDNAESLITEARSKVAVSLIITNLGVLIIGGWVSYMLARKSLKPIEEAHATLERFTADASHELRTPISAMKSEIEVALMQPKISSKEAKALLQSNLEELDILTRLSDNLLKLARLDNQTINLSKKDVSPIIQSVIDRLLPLAEKKNILIENKSNKLVASTDENSLSEVLVIILDNAIKYSPSKSVITISTNNDEKSPKISIKDQGIGISKAEIGHIFDRFYQSDTARSSQNRSGHGLGLSIAKRMMNKLGGDIEVASSVGKGSKFTIKLG